MAGPRVLVVEDDYFIAQDIVAALEGCGATVVGPTASARQAVDIVASDRPIDLAILDIDLRGARDFSVAEALDARGIPFVFATAYDRTVVPARFAGARFWEKPFDAERLARSLAGPPPSEA